MGSAKKISADFNSSDLQHVVYHAEVTVEDVIQ